MDSADLVGVQNDKFRVKRKTIEAMLQQCQMALEQLASGCNDEDSDTSSDNGSGEINSQLNVSHESATTSSAPTIRDTYTSDEKFYGLLKSGVECPDFLRKLEDAQASLYQNITEDSSSWDMVSENDLDVEPDPDDYVLVGQEDIMEGIASFMAAYLLSLKQTKDLSPNQLQEALSKTFSLKKKKGKLRKAWDGSKVIYNVASWGATAIGIYQNPALFRAASAAFWTSCHVISKFF